MSVHDHVVAQCTSEEVCCPKCNLNIYRIYHDSKELYESHDGHDCLKDLKRENEKLKNGYDEAMKTENVAMEAKLK